MALLLFVCKAADVLGGAVAVRCFSPDWFVQPGGRRVRSVGVLAATRVGSGTAVCGGSRWFGAHHSSVLLFVLTQGDLAAEVQAVSSPLVSVSLPRALSLSLARSLSLPLPPSLSLSLSLSLFLVAQ